MRESTRGWRWDLAGLALAVLAAALRCAPWSRVFGEGGVALIGVDSYYHVRRVQLLIEAFPDSPRTDPFISFPSGGLVPWPPGFDTLVALASGWRPDAAAIAAAGTLLMPLLGALATFLAYRLGRRAFDPLTGLVAAALFAALPGAVDVALLGRLDHHALAAPVFLGIDLAFLACLGARSTPRRLLASAVCGALVALAVASWIVTPSLYFAPVPATAIALCALGQAGRVRRPALGCLAGALTGATLAVLATGDLEQRPFDLFTPSWFMVSLFAAGLAALAATALRPRWLLPLGAALALANVGVVAVAPELTLPLRRAFEVAAGSDPHFGIAWETYPIFRHGDVFTLDRVVNQYSHLGLLLPVAIAALGWRVLWRREGRPGAALVAISASFGLALLCTQQRFGEFAVAPLALVAAWALVATGRALWALRATAGPRRAAAWSAALALALGAALSPLPGALASLQTTTGLERQRDLTAFGRALRAHTPDPGDPAAPEYGLLTSWMDAHPLLVSAGRPVAVSSFASREALPGNRAAFRALLSADEALTVAVMREQRLRYVVVSSLIESVEDLAAIAGIEERFAEVEVGADAGGAFKRYHPLRPFAEAVHTRLLLADGSARRLGFVQTRGLGRLRLHLESPVAMRQFGVVTPAFKAFEAVAGASLSGTAPPGTAIELSLPLETNVGRRFVYTRRALATADGRFALVVPYATDGAPGPTRAVGPYTLRMGDALRRVRVSERDVRAGAVVAVPGPRLAGRLPWGP